jgi:hypothetical protein
MKGRRLPVINHGTHPEPLIGELNVPLEPGDYCGPLFGYTGDKAAVFFLKPNARDADAPQSARQVQHVISPPHTFTEEPDGTLTISASIGNMHPDGDDGWHGFLEKGVWRKA